MVELVEVEDESFETKQAGPSDNEDDYYTDTGKSFTTVYTVTMTLTLSQTPRFLPMTKTASPRKRHWQSDYSPFET